MTAPLADLMGWADRPDSGFGPDDVAGWPAGALDRLVAAGVVAEAGAAAAVRCPGCDHDHVEPVRWVGTPVRRAFVTCPEAGLVRVDPAALRRWAVDPRAVAVAVLRLAGGTGAPAEVVPGRLWHLGRIRAAGRARDAYLARGVNAETRPAVAAALAGRPSAVVFVPTEAAAARWGGAPRNPLVAVESAVPLGPEGLTFDPAAVEARVPDAGPTAGKKVTPKRAVREAAIAKLTTELREHLRTARDHAYATLALSKTAKLLKRPTQLQLAKRTGLSKWVVSRCLRDKSAHVLRHLWAAALDLGRVMLSPGPLE